jgi:CheY-like chemotaxis protein
LKEDIEPDLPMVRADPMRLRQILINLLSNAAKFTEEGSIIVNAKVHTTIAGKKEVMVSVTDSGPGISAEDQKKLFQAFSQVDSSPTRKTGGTGLGLSICQQLVKLHGGRIGIHSQVGKGSTFYFTIPVFGQEPEIKEENKGNVVLCIDDDAQVISLYERYLIPRGYQVIALTDPTKARETVKKIKPYAITLDIMMPGYDGWQVIADLKSDPETHSYPVIVCSIVEEEEKGFSLGAADYLVKPILEDDLVDAMNRLNSDGSIQEILVIDDDIQDLRLIEKIFTERSQFKVSLAEGGQKGWEMLEERQPHAIILDLFMPDVDGFTILERLRTTPKFRDIPVIVVSGVDLNQEQRNQLENLGKRLLQKGMLNEEELFATLERALKRLEIKQGE